MLGRYQPIGVGMAPSKTGLGQFIRARRLELGLKQTLLAIKAGLTQRAVSRFEIGENEYLSDEQLHQLASVLQVRVEELQKRIRAKHIAQPKTELGKLIRSRREELGLSILEFAKKMEMTIEKVETLEIRYRPTICYALIKPLANALRLDISVLARFGSRNQKQTKSKLGQLVRTRRKELGMTAVMLAEKLCVSKQFVSQIEFGKCPLSEGNEMIERLAQILELEASTLEALRPKRRLKQKEGKTALGKFVISERLKLGLSLEKLAQKAGVSIPTILKIERKIYRPGNRIMVKLFEALGCEIPAEFISVFRPH